MDKDTLLSMDIIITRLYIELQSKTQILPCNEEGWCLISLPFLGQYNDCIEILVKEEGESILVRNPNDKGNAITTTKDKFTNVVLDLIQVWG